MADILDELKWELDFYVRMQRPDGHFMSSVKGRDATSVSPPSTSDEGRVYFDCTSPDGGGWSCGGVTLFTATANAVLALAHASIVFRSIGETATADGYRAAALSGWTWLDGHTPANAGERHLLCAAASAVYRMDPTQASARTEVESFAWATWDGGLPWSVTPGDVTLPQAAWHYLANAAGSASMKTTIGNALGQAVIDRAFDQEGAYGGLYGDPSNGWDWSWGSNSNQGMYGANLFAAVHFGVLAGRTSAEVEALAQKHVHDPQSRSARVRLPRLVRGLRLDRLGLRLRLVGDHRADVRLPGSRRAAALLRDARVLARPAAVSEQTCAAASEPRASARGGVQLAGRGSPSAG